MSDVTQAAHRRARWLWVLTSLFVLRVVAQPLALVVPPGVLPAFGSWDGGVLPYPFLLATQAVILVWLVRTARAFTRGEVTPMPVRGRVVLWLAGLYFVGSLARLVLGLTLFKDTRWFASPLPTIFPSGAGDLPSPLRPLSPNALPRGRHPEDGDFWRELSRKGTILLRRACPQIMGAARQT